MNVSAPAPTTNGPEVARPRRPTAPPGSPEPREPPEPAAAEAAPPVADEPIPINGGGGSGDDLALAFEDFYRASRPSIVRAVALAVGDVDLAAEAADEAMTRAYERWSNVARLERPEAWVYRVAVNWSTSVLRRRQRRRHDVYAPEAVDAPDVADPAIRAALAELDAKQRSVIVCRHLLGWSVAETADALDVRQGTVKSRLHRARQILQARLGHLHTPKEQQ